MAGCRRAWRCEIDGCARVVLHGGRIESSMGSVTRIACQIATLLCASTPSAPGTRSGSGLPTNAVAMEWPVGALESPRDRSPGRLSLRLRRLRRPRTLDGVGRSTSLHGTRCGRRSGARAPHRSRARSGQHPRPCALHRVRDQSLSGSQADLDLGRGYRPCRSRGGGPPWRHRVQHAGRECLCGGRARDCTDARGGAQDSADRPRNEGRRMAAGDAHAAMRQDAGRVRHRQHRRAGSAARVRSRNGRAHVERAQRYAARQKTTSCAARTPSRCT